MSPCIFLITCSSSLGGNLTGSDFPFSFLCFAAAASNNRVRRREKTRQGEKELIGGSDTGGFGENNVQDGHSAGRFNWVFCSLTKDGDQFWTSGDREEQRG